MGHILNKTFKIKYETHAYGIEYDIENVFQKWNEKKNNKNSVLILNWMWKKKIHFRNKNILRKELGLDGPPYTSLSASFPVVIAFSGSIAKKS